ncbi:YbdK family carboxylate-amine ligase [Conexibacter stalactiti]|uniref:Putative glutamate--cysteine ligase 2 n=1 Tax=Conexibacter stalactiti TaxID=1940611 RepID=A0ABU4HND6_9ACTN|nr:YbdK family carboxylate-amine ligase [Conexibacter stalactiti]MDW5594813.1 YbdK family carboxylate-amine ligase [Conexibacter stalactiti]MEC5035455.1 YbdK family carboxylate-amine ligase [Conexibacter stalactiti]
MGASVEDVGALPEWAEWNPTATAYTLGVEEEVMLLDPWRWSLAQRIEDALDGLPESLGGFISAETHQAAIELATEPHRTVAGATGQLRALRGQLSDGLAALGMAVAAAGTHPTATWKETEVSPAGRHQLIHETMRELARREPTFALHVHVGVAEAASATRLLNQMRAHVPLLLALSANSPFWQGRDAGICSARTIVFSTFPRTGIPRRFDDYLDWVGAVDPLIRAGAIPEPTFLWWDLRLQPKLGTLEIRIMDAQTRVEDTAALVALVQSVARLELEEGFVARQLVRSPEVLAENRFLALRDGMDADLIDPVAERLVPAREQLERLLDAARPHAEELGCRDELDEAARLAAEPGAARQRALAERARNLPEVVRGLAEAF